jgi:hypothetical protein
LVLDVLVAVGVLMDHTTLDAPTASA